jgi:DNA repair protein RecO (recombination protein O)
MHHIYHTEGIILGSSNIGEAGKYYRIFTRDLGMITATAQGVRKISSKLRFVLQDFAYLKIDIVAGRNIFRLTNAIKTDKLEKITKSSKKLEIFENVSRLLKRLLAGVEPNETLFDDLVNGLLFLEQVDSKDDLHNIETIIVLRILNNLGYIGDHDVLKTFTRSPFEDNIVLEASKNRKIILSEINKALKETHM